METTIEDAAALTGSAKLDISRRAVLVLCADNGVVAQGVSQTDSSVTRAVAENLAAAAPASAGWPGRPTAMFCPWIWAWRANRCPGVRGCRIAAGTADFTQGPAMSRAEAVQAVGEGIALARSWRRMATGSSPPVKWALAIPPPPARWRQCCWASPSSL